MIFFDLSVLDLMLLFDVLRKPAILTLLSVVNQTLGITQQNTQQLHDAALYELQFDCRRIYIEHYLNDQHDELLRRIFIRDVENQNTVYRYRKSEQNEAVVMYRKSELQTPVYLYRKSEILGLLDFVVVVPVGLVYNTDLLKAHIDAYRLPGMSYQIISE